MLEKSRVRYLVGQYFNCSCQPMIIYFRCCTDPLECPAGYYSNAGWAACKACDSGYACPAGSTIATPASGELINSYLSITSYFPAVFSN